MLKDGQVRDYELLAAGFDGYVSKPINPRTFMGQVMTWLAPWGDAGARAAAAPGDRRP